MFYTYVWKDSAGVPFYVGKGRNGRANDSSTRSKQFKAIHADGGCTVEIVDEFIHESEAFAHEIELIALYGRREFGGLLINRTDGGEGMCGLIRTPEHLAKIGAANKGRVCSLETRAKISASKKNPSAETRAKISAAKTNPSEETRVKMRLAKLGIPLSDDHRAKIGSANTGQKRSLESRARMSASRQGIQPSQDVRRRISVSLTGRPRARDVIDRTAASTRMSGPRSDNKSGFKGVSLSKGTKWKSFISHDGEHRSLGTFPTPEGAALAYDRAAYAAWGDKCYLNFGIPEMESA